MAEVPVDRVAERCNLDAIDCLEAWLKIESIIPKKAFDLEMRFLPVANKIQSLGIPIDRAAVHAHRTRLETEYNYMKMISEGSLGFNPGSTIQLAAILEGQGYVVPYKTTEGKRRPTLNKQVLETYYSQVAIAQWVLKYRSTQTLLTHLIKPLDNGEYLIGDKIHPKINLNTVRSGRISRSVPATQNIKESLRDIIVTSDPVNNQLISQDLSQIELRLAAWMWDDKEMLKIFAAGGDIHEGTAQTLIDQGLGNILLPTPRRVAKDINYLVLYGGDEYTMYNRKQIPMITGKKIFDAYFQTFKGIAYGIEATKEFARNNGYVETLYGRRRDESEKLGGNRKQVAAALREMVNHVIQGSAAELNKEILIALKDEPIIHTVHDEWIADAPIGHQLPNIEGIMPFHTPIAEGRGKTWQQAAH
jgi:DNA polymerase-1